MLAVSNTIKTVHILEETVHVVCKYFGGAPLGFGEGGGDGFELADNGGGVRIGR